MEETNQKIDEAKAGEKKSAEPSSTAAPAAEPAKKLRWNVKPGMTVRVHQKIREMTPKGEEKERVQIFEGIVLGIRGAGPSKTFTVRKISNGVGVEKIYPMDLPTIVNVEPIKQAKVKRAKLYNIKDYTKKLKETAIKA
jgi:large subunit ribosomal protein L19